VTTKRPHLARPAGCCHADMPISVGAACFGHAVVRDVFWASTGMPHAIGLGSESCRVADGVAAGRLARPGRPVLLQPATSRPAPVEPMLLAEAGARLSQLPARQSARAATAGCCASNQPASAATRALKQTAGEPARPAVGSRPGPSSTLSLAREFRRRRPARAPRSRAAVTARVNQGDLP
jgi:hypothetical protein